MLEAWRNHLDGIRKTTVGDYHLYIMLANRYQWTPQQIDAMDAAFIDELLIFIQAEQAHTEAKKSKQ